MAKSFDFAAPLWKGDIEDITTFARIGPNGGPNPSKPVKGIRQAEEFQGALLASNPIEGAQSVIGRILACPCYKRAYWSFTVRGRVDKNASLPKYHPSPCFNLKIDTRNQKLPPSSFFLPDLEKMCIDCMQDIDSFKEMDKWCGCAYKPKPERGSFLSSFEQVCSVLKDSLRLESVSKLTGAIIVTGTTSSGKSQITRGLIYYYLFHLLGGIAARYDKLSDKDQRETKERRPHLLTIENPIEKFLFEDSKGGPVRPEVVQALYGIDYTPRQLGTDSKSDVSSLHEALMEDALRQTPEVVYVGEMRDEEEWRAVMDFAGTGHLVIATAHAGSVVETMEKVMTAMKAATPAERGQIAQRIHAIVHLEGLTVKIVDHDLRPAVAPALWLGTPAGVAALVADGLASILPNDPREGEECYSIGRKWFLKQLLDKTGKTKNSISLSAAMDSDLRGM